VTLDGRIVLGDESKSLREKLTLVAAHVSAKTHGVSPKLCNLGGKFQELLQLAKLVTVFEVCNTEAAAVASCLN